MKRLNGSLSRGARRVESGMTLVELLAAMTISVVIGGMIILSWTALTRSYANTVRRGEASDFTRLAMSRMEREIRDSEQPPAAISEVAVVRARPYTIVLYTTFNKTGNALPTTPPRLVMYRLYSNGELWRFQDTSSPADNVISGVNMSAEYWPPDFPGQTFSLAERTGGEGAQLMTANVVNATTPSAAAPTALFTYIYYNADGTLAQAVDVRGTDNRGQIRAVEMNLLIDMNPGKSPVHTHLRTTAQLRNTR
jgi:type II secretory pathway pseudopilin PulG